MMNVSESSQKIRKIIDGAINSHSIKRSDYDLIIHLATEDGFIDSQENALLGQLNDMIEDRTIKILS